MPDALTAPLRTLAEVEAQLTRYTVFYTRGGELDCVDGIWARDPMTARWKAALGYGEAINAVVPEGVRFGQRAAGALYFDSMGRLEGDPGAVVEVSGLDGAAPALAEVA